MSGFVESLAWGVPCPLAEVRSRLKHADPEDIPDAADLCTAGELESALAGLSEPPFSLLAGGDVMLGGRARSVIQDHGSHYPFEATRPLLARAAVVLVNQEGPFAEKAARADRRFSYRVPPRRARGLSKAGIHVATLANNHLMDCGPEGVLETLEALRAAGVHALGAGADEESARRPVILKAGPLRLGLLGYYWNARCAAGADSPGGARETAQSLRNDICALREKVDRVVVTFHWGIPYAHEPLAEDRQKARLAIEAGADAVIGHHPHVVQPFEVHQGRPIFYSIGNYAFGSGNSRAEGLLVGFRFAEGEITARLFPIYVKNRDPRINYQPHVLRGAAGTRLLTQLAQRSGESGRALQIEHGWGRLVL